MDANCGVDCIVVSPAAFPFDFGRRGVADTGPLYTVGTHMVRHGCCY